MRYSMAESKSNMIRMKEQIQLTILLVIFASVSAFAQHPETVVVGQVVNKFDQTPLESVSVYFKGVDAYTQTNSEGYFLIRHRGDESKLIFSLIGFSKVAIKIIPGQSVGVQIEMEEKVNLLQEIFVFPGANPADELMKEVRKRRKINNLPITQQSTEERVVFLSKKNNRRENNRIFTQFKNGNLSENDSILLVPVYLEETKIEKTRQQKQIVSENTFNTPPATRQAVLSLLRGLDTDINFYKSSVSILNKSFISPLANVGNSFYRFYLTDSITRNNGKDYVLKFRSKNSKNLAFNGELFIDSATYALTQISAELPHTANLNYIHNLRLHQKFQQADGGWIPQKEYAAWNITYQLLKDSITTPELMIHKSCNYSSANFTVKTDTTHFADTKFKRSQLEEKMTVLQQTPLFKVANYIADGLLTGYIKVGKIDIGPIINIARLTKSEGFRIGLPFRTNQTLWKNLMLGGYGAYGAKDKEWKYGAEVQWRLPIENAKVVLGASYLNDNRRIDYNYHDHLWRQDPLSTGDENIASTIFSFRIPNRISKREELAVFLKNDWNNNIESYWTYLNVAYYPNELLPFADLSGKNYSLLRTQSASHTTRISFQEKVINEHFQRIYLPNEKPVIYATTEIGKYRLENKTGNYAKVIGNISHKGRFMLGEWKYMIETGKIIGDVPYPLLKFPYGMSNGGYSRFEFAMMNNREFVADTYGILFSEIITNGLIFNNIPLIKHLNLREIASFKMAYGSLSQTHQSVLKIPNNSSAFREPYSEVSIGFCNLLGVISVQSIWRLSERNKPYVKKWGIKLSLLVTL